MDREIEAMWASKLGLINYNAQLVNELVQLMFSSKADYTILFRQLSELPEQFAALQESFYLPCPEELKSKWTNWLQRWRDEIKTSGNPKETSAAMQRVNPKYTWREWLIVPAYEKAAHSDYSLIKELQAVFSNPYTEQSAELNAKYNRLRPKEYFSAGGVSHYSCSS
jgi:uncharacterized protein YdiU (UPF0061 family)